MFWALNPKPRALKPKGKARGGAFRGKGLGFRVEGRSSHVPLGLYPFISLLFLGATYMSPVGESINAFEAQL